MNILFAADVQADPHSGASGTEYQTIEALRRLGHRVDCIWADDLPHRYRHGNLHYLLELPPAYRDAIQQRCTSQGYDVIHVNQPHCYLAARDHRRRQRPGVFVQRSHGWEPRSWQILAGWRARWNLPEKRFPGSLLTKVLRGLLARHNRLAARDADGTLVSCSACRDYIVRCHGIDPQRVAVIPQSAPDDYLSTPPAREEPGRALRVLYVGQWAFFKAPLVVAAAFRLLANRFPEATFTWVCAEAHHDEVRRHLGEAAGRCRVLAWMSQDALRQVYDEHGVFLFPSLFEGFGKVFLEAMSRGLGVVASNEGGMRDLIRDGDNGLLVPVGDAERLAEAAGRLMSDVALYQRLSRAARQTAQGYTWERVAVETLAFYERLRLRRSRHE